MVDVPLGRIDRLSRACQHYVKFICGKELLQIGLLLFRRSQLLEARAGKGRPPSLDERDPPLAFSEWIFF